LTNLASPLVAVATYNEIENLPRLVDEIVRYLPDAEVLVIDDNSPDGTGRWAAQRAAQDARVHLIQRAGKLGLGTATIAGMKYAIAEAYPYLITMDADFSHHPRYLPALVGGMESAGPEGGAVDVMIGSRYVAGGGVEGWPLRRHLMSRGVNMYARLLLRLPVRDCSGAFRCYRVQTLRRIQFDRIRSRGYSFQEEILWHLRRAGARFAETPILFVDRQAGSSKINLQEALLALWIIFRLALSR